MRTAMATTNFEAYDRAKAVKQFDDSKIGVKGLVDSGITSIPPFFVHPPETLSGLKPNTQLKSETKIPTIDLSGFDSDRRSSIVDQIGQAARGPGFFQIINHTILPSILDRTIAAIKAFHEQPTEVKGRFYRRDASSGVSYVSNVDLFQSKAASWRDTLQVRFGSMPPEINQIPEICREEILKWDEEIRRLGEVLMELVSEGLGLSANRLREMTCVEGRTMVGHYYPYCPQPDLTVGLASHTDPGVLTVLHQDQMGGLQVKFGDTWVDVKPVTGALVVNVGDLLQIISNDEYKSVEHRVLANSCNEPRVSIGVFFNPSDRQNEFGPLPELVKPERPALFKQFTMMDFLGRFFTKGLDGKSLLNYYRI